MRYKPSISLSLPPPLLSQRLTEYSRDLESELSFVQGQLKALYRDSSSLLVVAQEAQRLKKENASLCRQLQELKLTQAKASNTLAAIDDKAAGLAEAAIAQREAASAFLARFTPEAVMPCDSETSGGGGQSAMAAVDAAAETTPSDC